MEPCKNVPKLVVDAGVEPQTSRKIQSLEVLCDNFQSRWIGLVINFTDDQKYEMYLEKVKEALGEISTDWVFQVEKASRYHIQGCFSNNKRKRKTQLIKFLAEELELDERAIQLAKAKKPKNLIMYCQKEDETYVSGPWSSKDEDYFDILEGVELYEWQKEIEEILEKPATDNRKIYWYWDAEGNAGKSMFARHLYIKSLKDKSMLYLGEAKTSDVNQAIEKHHKKVILDLPRNGNCNYRALEGIKNGLVFSGKYESGVKLLKWHPHLIVFANAPPLMGAWSEDRYVIKEINKA